MNSNFTPTELQIQMKAVSMFPDNKELQSSFIQAVWHTVYHMKPKPITLESRKVRNE